MTSNESGDRRYLLHAAELARGNLQTGDGGPFGAVVVVNDRVAGEGSNQVLRSNDPTAHAEIVAIRRACAALNRFHLEGATLYTTCEPCPMCLSAAHWARIGRVVYAASRDDAAAIGFIDADLYALLEGRAADAMTRKQVPLTEVSVIMRAWLDSPLRRPY